MTKLTLYKIAAFRLVVFLCLLIFCWGCILAVYGSIQLYTRTDRLDLAEFQKAKIANLETKIVFLENNDWAMAIQQLPPIVQDMLAALNEGIKQKKHREYERYEQPLLTEKEIDGYMIKFIGKWWVFVLIGIVPLALGDYGLFTWQWWVTIILLNLGVNTHHSCF